MNHPDTCLCPACSPLEYDVPDEYLLPIIEADIEEGEDNQELLANEWIGPILRLPVKLPRYNDLDQDLWFAE